MEDNVFMIQVLDWTVNQRAEDDIFDIAIF